ncbi:MAG: Fic family protein, partial [Burkholderiales bacterium]|nr:Fic family protein [Burkholderiales bacterium]
MNDSTSCWIWQTDAWPPLAHDGNAIQAALTCARGEFGRLQGKVEAVGKADMPQTERDIWTRDALATAAIEGETLNPDAVRSSVARRLGLADTFTAAVPRNVEGLLDVMQDAATNWNALTEQRLFEWHTELFPPVAFTMHPIVAGQYRSGDDPMQIVSGPLERQKVHYSAPPAADVPAQMHQFIGWFNESRKDGTDGLVRAALAHLWFESIHPFEDGNGRLGRAIVDLALSQDAGYPFRLHGLSHELKRRQADYYDALNRVQRAEAKPEAWVQWLLETLQQSCINSSKLIDEALDRTRFWSRHKEVSLNERQRKVLAKMLDAGPGRFEGGMSPRKAQSLTGAAGATATRDLTELVGKGLMVRRGAGRSTHY